LAASMHWLLLQIPDEQLPAGFVAAAAFSLINHVQEEHVGFMILKGALKRSKFAVVAHMIPRFVRKGDKLTAVWESFFLLLSVSPAVMSNALFLLAAKKISSARHADFCIIKFNI
jgi:hypothetical protein